MLEKKAFLAKDAVLVIDDFTLAGTTADVQRLHREATGPIRGAGNRSPRSTWPTGGSRPTYYLRGSDRLNWRGHPSGQSLRARLLVVEVTPGDIDTAVLSRIQRDAGDGVLATAMAGYVQWLAPRIDDLRRTLPDRQCPPR